MFAEEVDYWLLKLLPPPLSHCGLHILKWPQNYKLLELTPWQYVVTTLDFAYLEMRRTKVIIERSDPCYVEGDFGGKFAVYGKSAIEENRITKYFGFKLDEHGRLTHDIDEVVKAASYLCLLPTGHIRKLTISEKRMLKLEDEQKAISYRKRVEEEKNSRLKE